MDTSFANEALSNPQLYIDIVNYRYIFNRLRNIDYHLHHLSKICIIPPESVQEDYKRDYENMQQSFIYGQSLSYNDLMTRILELQNRLRKVKLEGDFSIQ